MLAEGEGTAAVAHVAGCAGLRGAPGRGARAHVRCARAEVPEPPPLFWEAFRRNVRPEDRG